MLDTLSTFQSDCTNPTKNLALEEYLLTKVNAHECILYLWQNKNTVVVGRNQNCWRECKVKELEENDGHLVRRLSGGGAVFHDMGNLNFTFLVRKENYDVDRQLNVIITALKLFNIDAVKSGRNDITVDGKKISGNAFYKTGDYHYHHGTLLIDANLEHLSRYLSVSIEKMQSNGVSSVKSRVANLVDFNSSINTKSLSNALIEAFEQVYGLSSNKLESCDFNQDILSTLENKFASWEWRFGRPITFDYELHKRFSWGEIQFQLVIQNGIIALVNVFSDCLDTEFIPLLSKVLIGCTYDLSSICERIHSLSGLDSDVVQDVCTVFREVY